MTGQTPRNDPYWAYRDADGLLAVCPPAGLVRAACDLGGRNDAQATHAEWYTPPHVFNALGLRFDLDPCAPAGGVSWIPAQRHYSIADNGLAQPWKGRVWLNPPYGRGATRWIGRLMEHGDGVALVFARVDAAWAQSAIRAADAVCLISGRLSFVSGSGAAAKGHNAAAPSMLLGYGSDCGAAVRDCGLGLTFSCRTGGDMAYPDWLGH